MTDQHLATFLTLERLEQDVFRGESRNLGTPQVYGGQVLGQSLRAAQHTVENRLAHSIHAYFLRKGDFNAPIIYQVDRSRDGGSYSSRRVVAIQHGQPIFTMSASFQIEEEGLEYFPKIENLPDLPDETQLPQKTALKSAKAENIRADLGFDIAMANDADASQPNNTSSSWWIKARENNQHCDDAMQQAMFAYSSDGVLLATSLKPHGYSVKDFKTMRNKFIFATIDHAIWYHRSFRADQWIFCRSEPIATGNGRAFVRGSYYDLNGVLVATCTQEGLIRERQKGST